jgi:large subunit ribosomal protein L17
MRHGKKINHLGRTASHRSALLSNMASSLILNKRITTTVAKAKALKKYVEPLITKAKTDSTHSRRTVMSYLQNKDSVKVLFGEVAGRTADRPGGYTRIIKMGDVRLGDNAEMCLFELVDFNDLYKKDGAEKKAKTRRSRKGKKAEAAEAEVDTAVAEVKEEKPKKAAKKASKKTDK